MIYYGTISAKRQVVLNKRLCEALGVRPGDKLVKVIVPGGMKLIPLARYQAQRRAMRSKRSTEP